MAMMCREGSHRRTSHQPYSANEPETCSSAQRCSANKADTISKGTHQRPLHQPDRSRAGWPIPAGSHLRRSNIQVRGWVN